MLTTKWWVVSRCVCVCLSSDQNLEANSNHQWSVNSAMHTLDLISLCQWLCSQKQMMCIWMFCQALAHLLIDFFYKSVYQTCIAYTCIVDQLILWISLRLLNTCKHTFTFRGGSVDLFEPKAVILDITSGCFVYFQEIKYSVVSSTVSSTTLLWRYELE